MKVTIEQWKGDYWEQEVFLHDCNDIKNLLQSIETVNSAIITLEAEASSMFVNASKGLFSLVYYKEDATYYYLTSLDNSPNDVDFLLGGQKINIAKKYVLSLAQTQQEVIRFFASPKSFAINDNWDLQI
jgi:hypothetical protein